MYKSIQFRVLILCFSLMATSLFAGNISYSVSNSFAKEIVTAKDTLFTTKRVLKTPALPPTKTFRKFKSLERFDTPVIPKKIKKSKVKEGFQFNSVNAAENKDLYEQALAVFKVVEETQNYIDELKTESLSALPVAISPVEISNVKYTVGIAKAVFTPSGTKLTAFLKIETPRTSTINTTTADGSTSTVEKEENNVLILGASDIMLSHDGGIVGETRLNLISQFAIDINNGAMVLTLKGGFEESGTYAVIDCFGFKEMGIDANITFSSELIYPVDQDGKKRLDQLSADFKIVASDWNNILVDNITLPEFGIKGLEGTTFKMEKAVLDFSDLNNSVDMPSEYAGKYYGDNPELWRGVYIKSLNVMLPKAFKKNNDDKRVSFLASNLIIDTRGITGRFEGENILSIDEGSASKWKFSLDKFEVDIDGNSLRVGEFNGEMLLPVSEETRLKYDAIIQPEEYSFRVTQTDELSFDVWNGSEVKLTEDSYVEMKIKDDKFRPKASLNGSFNIVSGLKKDDTSEKSDKTIQFGGIVFQKLELQTEAPKFQVAYFGAKGKLGIANFPVSINEIGLETPSGNSASLIIDFSINLTSESDGGNGGGCRLKINSDLVEIDGYERWKYDGIDLERVNVQMDVAGMQLKGAIFIFEDDPTYGKGFAGAVGAKFTVGMSLEVEAKALFGRTDDFRYWFADAQVTLPTPIPIFTGFAINSFGGGFYNRMKMDGVSRTPDAAFNEIGASTSGVVYVPDNTNGLGFKATVGIITQNSEELFHASLEFGMSFLRSGGLQEIYFKGEGELISSIPGDFYDKLADKLAVISKGADAVIPAYQPEGSISANVFIRLDFVNEIFHATSEVYVNFGVIDGVGPNGRAGWMDFYVAPGEWHILIGTPDDPIGTALDLGILRLKTESYFMTGDNVPGSPPPPAMVAEILGVDASKLDYMRDFNSLESGKGLAFGAHFSMSTGDLRFLIFYARFDAGVGFDIMLKDYGEAKCKGSSSELGLNGWYANGQAYAYLQGSVGLKFKIFGKRKKINVFSGGGAVLLQARMPNPIWMRGYLGGRYSLLGGLIKGSFRFKVELGEKCEIEGGSVLDGLLVIGDMTPDDGGTDVDVFAAPQVAFNLQINKIFEMPDDEGNHQYKILMDKFELTNDGKPVIGEVEWSNGNDVATFYSHEILPPNSKLKAYVQLHFEEYINGRWVVITDNGKPSLDTKEVNFVTGTAPETIPLSNIEYMYPVKGQKNFFKDEYNVGYINLKRGQSYLFDAVPNWDKNVRITSETGAVLNESFGYNSGKKQITFSMPEEISTSTGYNVNVVLVPEETDDVTVTEVYTSTNLSSEETGNELEIRSKELGDTVIKGDERELVAYEFSTSEYTTFEKKMNARNKKANLYNFTSYPYALILSKRVESTEPFDLTELVGNSYTDNKPLVVARATMDDSYYKNSIYPLLYKEYPLAGEFSVKRKTDVVGVPPVEGVEPASWYLSYLELEKTDDIDVFHPYDYNLAHYYYNDYQDLRNQLTSSNLEWEGMTRYSEFLTESFPLMKKDTYKAKLQYVLPGQFRNGGSDIVKFVNPIYE